MRICIDDADADADAGIHDMMVNRQVANKPAFQVSAAKPLGVNVNRVRYVGGLEGAQVSRLG